jgi:FMN-dependent NADH-azoreductase
MSKYLFVESSVRGDASASGQLAARFKEQLLAAGHTVVTRDVGSEPLPALDGAMLGALFSAADTRSAEEQAQADRVTALIDELQNADTIVIATGMYNFGVPAQLKTWFDYVLQAGRTFRYTADGPIGLVTGKQAVILAATGGIYSSGPGAAADFMVPHVQQMLAFMGINSVSIVRAEGLALGQEAAKAAMDRAFSEVDTLQAA